MNQQLIHMGQLVALLITGIVLILFAHAYIPPDVVYTSTIASVAGVVGARIAQNGYVSAPVTATVTTVSTSAHTPPVSPPLAPIDGPPDGSAG